MSSNEQQALGAGELTASALARAMDPALWSADEETAHMAASPLHVSSAREWSLVRAEQVLNELASPATPTDQVEADGDKVLAADVGALAKKMLGLFNGGLVNVHDDSNARGYTTYYRPEDAMAAVVEAVRSHDREMRADAYRWRSGKMVHASDCATSNAPAYEPGPCDCVIPAPDKALMPEAAAEVVSYNQQELTATVRVRPGLNGGMPFDIGALLYTTPTPVEELEKGAADRRTQQHIKTLRWLAGQYLPGGLHDVKGAVNAAIAALAATNAGQVETATELRALYQAYVRLLESGRDRIIQAGGDCDPVGRMEKSDPALIRARAAITALTNQVQS